MRTTRVIGGLGIVAASLGMALTASPAGALTTVCMPRTTATGGKVPWTLRQASGLTSLPGADGILYTHNDRGLRDIAGTRRGHRERRGVGHQARRHAARPLPAHRRAGRTAHPLLRHRGHQPRCGRAPRPRRHGHERRPSRGRRRLPLHAAAGRPEPGLRRAGRLGRDHPDRLLQQRDHPEQGAAERGVDDHRRGRQRMVHPPQVGQAVRVRRRPRPRSTPPPGRARRPGPYGRRS